MTPQQRGKRLGRDKVRNGIITEAQSHTVKTSWSSSVGLVMEPVVENPKTSYRKKQRAECLKFNQWLLVFIHETVICLTRVNVTRRKYFQGFCNDNYSRRP